MVDIHSHILWGMDDGAASLEASLAMLASARQAGTTDIVATPHLNAQFSCRPGLFDQRIAELAENAAGGPRIHRGYEAHLTVDGVEDILRDPSRYSINATSYLLVELPHMSVGRHIAGVLKHLLGHGLTPIVAHPERNHVLETRPEMVEPWVEAGCLIQLTALSIVGGFGRPAKAASEWMLGRGLAHVVASDCHDPVGRHARLDEAYAATSSRYGAGYADLLFHENPRRIIEGARLAGGRQTFAGPSGRRWKFWKKEHPL